MKISSGSRRRPARRAAAMGAAMAVAVAVAMAGCASSAAPPPTVTGAAGPTPAEQAAADSGRPAYTRADVAFMQGMIAHHAQALQMTALAPPRAAAGAVRTLAERIDVSQRDEIAFMQQWLRDRGETVPDVAAAGHPAAHHGGAHAALMPGMLTADQLARLAAATGAAFDRLFLTFMIQHHQGALTMVEQLFATPGAGQDATVFRFASDVTADQETEIARMQSMLAAAPAPAPAPSTTPTAPGDQP